MSTWPALAWASLQPSGARNPRSLDFGRGALLLCGVRRLDAAFCCLLFFEKMTERKRRRAAALHKGAKFGRGCVKGKERNALPGTIHIVPPRPLPGNGCTIPFDAAAALLLRWHQQSPCLTPGARVPRTILAFNGDLESRLALYWLAQER